jgi:hypothetical protein
LVGAFDNQVLFPDICTTSGKWFREGENCFVAAAAKKHGGQNPNDFSERGL